jgi:hypothetical protein
MDDTIEDPTIIPAIGLEECVIGPFKINETAGNVDYIIKSAQILDADDSKISTYTIVAYPSSEQVYKDTLEETIGQNLFYIKIPALIAEGYNLTNVTLKIEYGFDYYDTTSTLWQEIADVGNSNPEEQPVILIEKTKPADVIIQKSAIDLTGLFNIQLEKLDENQDIINTDTTKFNLFDASRRRN